jgi:flavin-dependent dehydrogenase
MPDVVIAGAGIAGSALAIGLARQGREVVLIDRATFPREKVCGEGVMPAGVDAIDRLGVSVRGQPFRGVCYHAGGRAVQGDFPRGAEGLGVRRRHLDDALVRASEAAGARVLTGIPVEGPIVENGAVTGLRAGGTEFRARLTVAADGANSLLRHKLGWDATPPPRRFGVSRHFRLARQLDSVHVFLELDREVYVTPLPDDEVLVAVLRATSENGGSRFPERIGLDLLEGAEPVGPVLGAAPLTVRARQRWGPGCVLLGDAAGNCDPITGGGISQALLAAELLACNLTDLRAFDRARERMLCQYRRLTAATLALARHPLLIPPALSILDTWPGLFSNLLGIAGGTR